MDRKIKAPPPAGRMWLVGLEIFGIQTVRPTGAFAENTNDSSSPSAIPAIGECALSNDHAGR